MLGCEPAICVVPGVLYLRTGPKAVHLVALTIISLRPMGLILKMPILTAVIFNKI